MNCFGISIAWFTKRRAVENPLPDVAVGAGDDPLPSDLTLVDNHILNSSAVDDGCHSPLPLVDQPSVNDSHLDVDVLVENTKRRAVETDVAVGAGDDPLPSDLTLVDNHILNSPAVDDGCHSPLPLVDQPSINDSHLDVDVLVENRSVDHPSDNYPLSDNSLVYHPSVDDKPVSLCDLPAFNDSTYHNKNLLDLPNHIITDILIKLPARCVFRCQCASKLLEILATTPFFVRRHLAQSTSVIAMQSFSQSSDRKIKFYFMDELQAKTVEKSNLKLDFCYMKKESPLMLYDSYDGFLLFKNTKVFLSWTYIFVVWNPATEEQVTITMDREQVCGFFFNPNNKEYEVLLASRAPKSTPESREYDFEIRSFGSKLRRNIGTYSYMPCSERPPTIINGTLYWLVDESPMRLAEVKCSNSIMAFEIGTNKFSTMGHGGTPCVNPGLYGVHDYMHLLEMEGQLGLCVFLRYIYSDLVLWVLNPTTNSWAKAYSVTFPKYSMPKYISSWPNELHVEVVKIKEGKLLVRQYNRLLLCDLVLGTHKIVEKKGFEDDSFRPVIHTPSLVSLGTDKLIQL